MIRNTAQGSKEKKDKKDTVNNNTAQWPKKG
jgi:hypothetical protein